MCGPASVPVRHVINYKNTIFHVGFGPEHVRVRFFQVSVSAMPEAHYLCLLQACVSGVASSCFGYLLIRSPQQKNATLLPAHHFAPARRLFFPFVCSNAAFCLPPPVSSSGLIAIV